MSCFERKCTDSLFKLTGGVPRLINLVCDTALLISQINKQRKVDSATLTKASIALRSDAVFSSRSYKTKQKSHRSGMYWGPIYFFISFLAIIAVVFFLGHRGYFGKSRTTTPRASTNKLDSAKQPVAESPLSGARQHKKFGVFPKHLSADDDTQTSSAKKPAQQNQIDNAANAEEVTVTKRIPNETSSVEEHRSVGKIPDHQDGRKGLSANINTSQPPPVTLQEHAKRAPSQSFHSQDRSPLPLPDR